jgi:ferric-dicitrate binding protein FerR (iron transport regulator)
MSERIPSPPPLHVIERYFAEECTTEEREMVMVWVAASVANAQELAAYRAVWRHSAGLSDAWDVDRGWEVMAARVDGNGDTATRQRRAPGPELPRSRKPSTWRRWVAGAAAAAVVAAALLQRAATHDETPAPPAPMRVVATQRGQRAVLDLADGSRVMLGAESTLRIPTGFGESVRENSRDLYLDGKAYFEVRHDSEHPFRVHTATGVAEDVGTSFVVTAYPETGGMEVAVTSGAVTLDRPAVPAGSGRASGQQPGPTRPMLTLTRGDLGRLDSAGTATLTRNVDLSPYLAWAQGRLVFDDTRLADAVQELARTYDLDIRLADSALADRRFNASFGDETPSQVMQRIALTLDLSVERHGDVFRLGSRARRSNAR